MSMFRWVWDPESRSMGSKAVDSGIPSPEPDNSDEVATAPSSSRTSPAPLDTSSLDRPVKRRRSSSSCLPQNDCDGPLPAKRMKQDSYALPSPQSTMSDGELMPGHGSAAKPDLEDARETIQFQFGLEILLKHDELRLIDQELAKCQIALEQLRRCHLIPYPINCPTPEHMVDISSGKGPALQTRPGEAVPRWAPPFGVVDGPYARHYAKWLIPDPAFGDVLPQPQGLPEGSRPRSTTAEGRATRNSTDFGVVGKARPGRANAGQKLQALSSGYPQPKDKGGPCTVKKSNGETVKLICNDCKRWNFSSTQGFINHCRIAHKRDYKSHEEAAVDAGHPIELDEAGSIIVTEVPSAAPVAAPASGLVHPYARNETLTDQQGYAALLSRINDSMELYRQGRLPNVTSIPTSERAKENVPVASSGFKGTPATPYLSQLLQKRKFSGNLKEQVEEAKTKIDLDDVFTPAEESDSDHGMGMHGASSPPKPSAPTAARTPGVMRMPARSVVSPVPLPTIPRPASSKGHVSTTSVSEETVYYDAMDLDLSPNTATGYNAPSLVSDDGEYDDSDDGSSSSAGDGSDVESVSDVAEINIDEDTDETPRPVRDHHTPSATTVKLRKEEAKHVTFVTPITGNGKAVTGTTKPRRKQNL